MISWLHISDLHMKKGNDADQQNSCSTFLRACREGSIQADFVVATGDFHNYWDTGDYSMSRKFLIQLMDALHLDIQEDLFMVPGNHDITDSPARSKAIRDFYNQCDTEYTGSIDDSRDYKAVLSQNADLVQSLTSGFPDYCKLVTDLIGEHYSATSPASVHMRTWREKINLLHLNTSLLSDGDKLRHKEAVDIAYACSTAIRKQMAAELPTLVLGHHSFYDLHGTIQDSLIELFNQTNVCAYLAGDQHRANNRSSDYLIDRKTGTDAWPNIVCRKLTAADDDDYSDFGAILYTWDERDIVYPKQLGWAKNGSGLGLFDLGGEAIRPFHMQANHSGRLYEQLLEKLKKTRKNHPSFQLVEISEELFPNAKLDLDIHRQLATSDFDSKSDVPKLLKTFFQMSWKYKGQNHLSITGEGGIGKTVTLLSLVVQDGFLPRRVPAVYIPLHALSGNIQDPVSQYLLDEVFHQNMENLKELKLLANQKWMNDPSLILLVDGFNEIAAENRPAIAKNIRAWSLYQGVQLVIASRYDVRNYLSDLQGDYHSVRLQPLKQSVIRAYLKRAGVPIPKGGNPVWMAINYPLMLSLYVQNEKIRLFSDRSTTVFLDWKISDSAGAIVWNYLQRELWRCQNGGNHDVGFPAKCVQILEYVAPFIAWKMVQKQVFFLSRQELQEEVKAALSKLERLKSDALPMHIQNVLADCGGFGKGLEWEECYQLLTQDLNLFRMGRRGGKEVGTLMHQAFRDCFAAIHLLNTALEMSDTAQLPPEWMYDIDCYVLNAAGELIEDHVAQRLWEANRSHRPTNPVITKTMLELQKRLRNYDFSQLDFSGMDLREVCLYPYIMPGQTALRLPTRKNCLRRTMVSPRTFRQGNRAEIITAAAFSPDGQRCIISTSNGTLQIWDIHSGQYILSSIEENLQSAGPPMAVLDGQRCVAVTRDWDAILVWDILNGEPVCRFEMPSGLNHVKAIAVTGDGEYCVGGMSDGALWRWEISSGHCVQLSKADSSSVNVIAVTPDNQRCLVGSSNGNLTIWDIKTGRHLVSLWHQGPVNAIAIFPDGRRCVSGTENGALHICDIEKEDHICCLTDQSAEAVKAVAVTEDGQRCVSVSNRGTISIWDLEREISIKTLEGYSSTISSTAITADGKYCACGSSDGTLYVWDVEIGQRHILNEGTSKMSVVAVSSSVRQCVGAALDGSLHEWNWVDGKYFRLLEGSSAVITAQNLSANGAWYVAALSDHSVRIWDVKRGDPWIFEGYFRKITAMAITNDGTLCVCASGEGLCVWNTKSKAYRIVKSCTEVINRLEIAADGQYCVGVSVSGSLNIWNMHDGRHRILKGHSGLITAMAITPNGQICISASDDCTLCVWELSSGQRLRTLEGHSGTVTSVDITADGRYCVSISNDYTLRVWNVQNGQCLKILDGFLKTMDAVALHPMKPWGIIASKGNGLRIWNLKTGWCVRILETNSNTVSKIAVTPDGRFCACILEDNGGLCALEVRGDRRRLIKPMIGISLFNVDFSEAVIRPRGYAETLRQNGAKISQRALRR